MQQVELPSSNEIIRQFGGLNWCQQHFSLSTAGIRGPLSLSSLNQGLKK